ncbi:MAG: hypothetical protein RJA07_988 [Bacteroidota bacterium]|jgi:hypothetical protein
MINFKSNLISMKKYLLLIFISILFIAKADAQINWGIGSKNLDSCNFISSCHLISLDTSIQNIWQQGVSNKSFFGNTNGVFTDSVNVYPKNNHSFFEIKTPIFYSNIIISFTHKFETDKMLDGGYIEYFNTLDSVWKPIVSGFGNFPEAICTENFYATNDTLVNRGFGFSGNQSSWITSRVEFIWFFPVRVKKSNYDSIAIRFHFISDSIQTNKAGWIIKDFMITHVDLGSGINELNAIHFVNIFPNPTTSTFTISKNTNEALQFHLYNLIGQQVLNKNLKEAETSIERNNLAAGTYLFSITNALGRIIENGKLIFNE